MSASSLHRESTDSLMYIVSDSLIAISTRHIVICIYSDLHSTCFQKLSDIPERFYGHYYYYIYIMLD